MTVGVITDSAASLPAVVAADHDVAVVPLCLTIGDRTYHDGDLALTDVAARLGEGISTSNPTPGDFEEVIRVTLTGHDRAVICTIASTMSSTYDAARVAASLHDHRVAVVDTATAAGAEGLVALAAADAAATGAEVDDVVAAAHVAMGRVRLVATVGNLEQLVRSGRVPGIAGWAAVRMGVNPLFAFTEGTVHRLRPAMSRAAALDRIVGDWRGSNPDAGRHALHVVALHAGPADEAAELLDRVEAEVTPETAFVTEFSPVMVAHTGSDLVGLAWWWEPAPPA